MSAPLGLADAGGGLVAGLARRRSMCRDYSSAAVSEDLVASVVDVGHRAPSAGNVDARRFLALVGRDDVGAYWDTTLSVSRREAFPWPGLLTAPVLLVLWTRPGAYTERYAEADKAHTGLGDRLVDWPVPYWWVDGGMAAEGVLLAAEEHGLGACFFGLFDHEPAVAERFGVAEGWRSVGTISLGWPTEGPQRRSISARRGRPELDDVLYKGRWGTSAPGA